MRAIMTESEGAEVGNKENWSATLGNDTDTSYVNDVASGTVPTNAEEASPQNFRRLYLRSELLRTGNLLNEIWAMDENRRLQVDLICSRVDLREEQKKTYQQQVVEECGPVAPTKVLVTQETQTTLDSYGYNDTIIAMTEECLQAGREEDTSIINAFDTDLKCATLTPKVLVCDSGETVMADSPNGDGRIASVDAAIYDQSLCVDATFVDADSKKIENAEENVRNTPRTALDSPDLFARIANKFNENYTEDHTRRQRLGASGRGEQTIDLSSECDAEAGNNGIISRVSTVVSTRSRKRKENEAALSNEGKGGPTAVEYNDSPECNKRNGGDDAGHNVNKTLLPSSSNVNNVVTSRESPRRRDNQEKNDKRKKRIKGSKTSFLYCTSKAPVLKNDKRQSRRRR